MNPINDSLLRDTVREVTNTVMTAIDRVGSEPGKGDDDDRLLFHLMAAREHLLHAQSKFVSGRAVTSRKI